MIRATEMLERAEVHRDMARQTLEPKWRMEFNDRVERYQTVAEALRRNSATPDRQNSR